MPGRPGAAVLAVFVLLCACGGDPATVSPTASSNAVAPTPAEGSCDNLAGEEPAVLQVRDYAFDRACFAIRTGQQLSLVNEDDNRAALGPR